MRTKEEVESIVELGRIVNAAHTASQISFADMNQLGECLASSMTATVVMRATFLAPEWAQAHIAQATATDQQTKLDELARAIIEATPVAMVVPR